MKERKRFLLYYDWENLIQDMSDSDIASLTRWIFKYQNTWEISDMTYWAKLAFSFMRPVFDEDRKDWEETSKTNSVNAKKRWDKRASETMRPHTNESETMRPSTDIGIDSVIGIDIASDITETVSKDTGEQALEVIEDKKIEKKEYWDTDINKTLSYMSKAVWCTTFKESQAQQRIYWKHLFNLWKEIWLEEFNFRLESILSDQFKAKNCNKLAYLYWELKSFIHSPVIKPKEKESVMDIVL